MNENVQLSPHFWLYEFARVDSPIGEELYSIFRALCVRILEPIRAWAGFGSLIQVTSGNRSVEENSAVHGQSNSEHEATIDFCAADFIVHGKESRDVFDWMRNNPSLPFHQLILEHGEKCSVVHVSINLAKPGLRSVLEGATHNRTPYQHCDCVAYRAPIEADLSMQGDV